MNSSNNSCYSVQQPVRKEDMNLSTVMPILLTIVAVSNNLLVMFLVFCTKQLRKNINFYIVNMAVSDMITSLVICMRYIVSYLYEAHGILALNDVICKVVNYLQTVGPVASLLTLLVISSERCRAVYCPLNLANNPQPCFLVLLVLTWIIPGTIFIHEAVNSEYIPGTFPCNRITVFVGAPNYVIFVSSLVVLVFISLIVINIQTLRKLRPSTISLSELNEMEKRKRDKKFRSAVRMVLCSLVLYILCTCPGLAFRVIIFHVSPDFFCSTYVSVVSSVLYSLLIANSALGPVVYLIFLQDFREAFKNRFCQGIFCISRVTPAADQHNTLPCHQTRTSVLQNNPVFDPNDDI